LVVYITVSAIHGQTNIKSRKMKYAGNGAYIGQRHEVYKTYTMYVREF